MSRSLFRAEFAFVLALTQLCWALPSFGSANVLSIASICESAAQIASAESGVPLDVLRSISLTETGRKKQGELRPWPWTVNMEGVGKWFETVDAAQSYVDAHYSRGARSFDVGCFQINYRWHGQNFESVQAMFDPMTNARYAAKFLGDLYVETGDWSLAAGAYHSRSPKYAKKYRARFDRIRASLSEAPQPTQAPSLPENHQSNPSTPRRNTFPLLQQDGRPAGIASLVRIRESGGNRLIDLQGARSLLGN